MLFTCYFIFLFSTGIGLSHGKKPTEDSRKEPHAAQEITELKLIGGRILARSITKERQKICSKTVPY